MERYEFVLYLVGIVGAFLGIILCIVAYYLKSIDTKLVDYLKLILVNQHHTDSNKVKLDNHEKAVHKHANILQKIEGRVSRNELKISIIEGNNAKK